MVVQSHLPHHDLIDFTFEKRTSRPIDAQFVEVDVRERTVGVGVGVDQHAVDVLPDFTVIEHRHEVGPSLRRHVTKRLGLVVVQHPLVVGDHVLEGEVGTRLVVDRKRGSEGGLIAGVRPHPLADGQVPGPIRHIDFGSVVDAIKPQARTVSAGLPIAGVHAVERQVRGAVDAVVGHASRSVFKRPVMEEPVGLWRDIARHVKRRTWHGDFRRVGSLPREDEAVRAATLEEFDAEFMKARREVHPTRILPHSVHAVILDEAFAVDPQLRPVV